MKTVKKSKLIVQSSKYNFNDELQKTIDDYNKEGLIVRIENSFSNSSHVGGGGNTTSTTLYNYAFVVGYENN